MYTASRPLVTFGRGSGCAHAWTKAPAQRPAEDTAQLHAGPGVVLKGEISGCDMLRVEGSIEGTVVARQLVICPNGSFLGTAEIEEAEIEGKFDGTLNVKGRLFLRGTGQVSGTLSYGQIEVERGGEIVGDISAHQSASTTGKPPPNERPVPQMRPVVQQADSSPKTADGQARNLKTSLLGR